MSAVTRPRGPLPARVYWTRRLVVFGLAAGLVFGIGHLLGGGSDGKSDGDSAALTGSSSQQTHRPSHRLSATGQTTSTAKPKPTKTTTPLAEPDGPCSPSEVQVTPVISDAVAGREVVLTLELTSTESAACTWRVSKDTLAVKLTSGSDFIWSSQQCPTSITTQDVIVRKAQTGQAPTSQTQTGQTQASQTRTGQTQPAVDPVRVGVDWSGRRSDADCSRTTAWARPGYYHAIAAALGGTATDRQFELDYPTRPTVTITVHPTQKASPKGQPTGVSEPGNPD